MDDFWWAVCIEHTTCHNTVGVDELFLECWASEQIGKEVCEGLIVEASPAPVPAPASILAAFVGIESAEQVGTFEGFIDIKEYEMEFVPAKDDNKNFDK